jgi:hypothetical protein
MFLVQAGKRAEPLVRKALERGEYLPTLVTIAGDIGSPSLAPQIQRLTTHADPQVARAARDALDIMTLHKSAVPGSD